MWIMQKLLFVLGISQLNKLTSLVSGMVAQDVTCFLICHKKVNFCVVRMIWICNFVIAQVVKIFVY